MVCPLLIVGKTNFVGEMSRYPKNFSDKLLFTSVGGPGPSYQEICMPRPLSVVVKFCNKTRIASRDFVTNHEKQTIAKRDLQIKERNAQRLTIGSELLHMIYKCLKSFEFPNQGKLLRLHFVKARRYIFIAVLTD